MARIGLILSLIMIRHLPGSFKSSIFKFRIDKYYRMMSVCNSSNNKTVLGLKKMAGKFCEVSISSIWKSIVKVKAIKIIMILVVNSCKSMHLRSLRS